MKNILKITIVVLMTLIIANCSKDEIVLKKNSGILKSTNASDPKTVYDRKVYPFTAARKINAGSITVANDSFNLYVTVKSIAGFQSDSENIKMWLGTDLTLLDGGGITRPSMGSFPHKLTTQIDSGTFTVALASVPSYDNTKSGNQTIYFVIGADVLVSDGKGGTMSGSAFGGSIKGLGKSWWFYDLYVDSCCNTPTPILY